MNDADGLFPSLEMKKHLPRRIEFDNDQAIIGIIITIQYLRQFMGVDHVRLERF
jgi:hypothetical protein